MGASRYDAGDRGVIFRSEAKHSFILLKPKHICDSESVARAMAQCKGVKEVYLSSGSYAFVLAAECDSEAQASDIYERVKKAVKSDAKMSLAINHYVYKQR